MHVIWQRYSKYACHMSDIYQGVRHVEDISAPELLRKFDPLLYPTYIKLILIYTRDISGICRVKKGSKFRRSSGAEISSTCRTPWYMSDIWRSYSWHMNLLFDIPEITYTYFRLMYGIWHTKRIISGILYSYSKHMSGILHPPSCWFFVKTLSQKIKCNSPPSFYTGIILLYGPWIKSISKSWHKNYSFIVTVHRLEPCSASC